MLEVPAFIHIMLLIPIILRSDWPFTYNPGLIGQYCNIEPFDLFTNLVQDRSSRFGSQYINLSAL